MKVGDVRTIYEDPISRKKPEGKARLIKRISKDSDVERWRVEFLDDHAILDRWIINTSY